MAELTRSLDCAIALSYKRNPLSSKSRFVRAVLLVKGVHFYGFHSSYASFLKIHMIDPSYLTRAVTLLKSGVVMSKKFNAFESHISFHLQFMCDFNLYGCGWLDLGEVWRRGEDYFSDEEPEEGAPDYENTQAVRALFKSSPHPTQSRMELEVDVVAFHILNRHALSARKIHHKLSIPGPQLPTDPLVLSVRELWEDERRRRAAKGLDPSPELPADPSENSRRPGGDWIAEARWWDEIKRRIEAERGQEEPPQDKAGRSGSLLRLKAWMDCGKTYTVHGSQSSRAMSLQMDQSQRSMTNHSTHIFPLQSTSMPVNLHKCYSRMSTKRCSRVNNSINFLTRKVDSLTSGTRISVSTGTSSTRTGS
jgi:hypothetical protein